MRISKQSAVYCVLLLAAQPALAADRGPWGLGGGVTVLSDDNVTRAQNADDVKKDVVTRVNVDGRYALDFSHDHSLIFNGFVQDERYRDYDGVSNQHAGLELEYRFRTRRGFTAPVYSVFVRGLQADYDTDNRDGGTLEYGLRFRRRFTDRISVAGGAGRSERTADGQVFDLEQTRYFAHLDYNLAGGVQMYLAYYYIDGDAYSIASASPTGAWSGYGDAYEWDPAFSTDRRRWAYRLDAQTDVIRLGANIGINRTNAIDISIDTIDSASSDYGTGGGAWQPGYVAGSVSYDATVFALSYLHRF